MVNKVKEELPNNIPPAFFIKRTISASSLALSPLRLTNPNELDKPLQAVVSFVVKGTPDKDKSYIEINIIHQRRIVLPKNGFSSKSFSVTFPASMSLSSLLASSKASVN